MQPIAYFSAEYAFDELPIFAGGLGVLATDFLREVSSDEQPFIMVGLFYHHGFESAEKAGEDKLKPESSGWEVVSDESEELIVSISLRGEDIAFKAWSKQLGNARVYLLDCDIESNRAEVRRLTGKLYDKDFESKVLQDALLGIGGVELLNQLKIKPKLYHLNEGHSALAALALLANCRKLKPHATLSELREAVCETVVATKHTILSAAGLYITHDLFTKIFSGYLTQYRLPVEEVFAIARDPIRKDEFSTTRLMLELSRSANAVSALHAKYEKKNHPNSPYKINSITNGINLGRWQDARIESAQSATDLWQAHNECRRELIEFVNLRTSSQLDPNTLTIVWARRITAYKRPLEIFNDIAALRQVINNAERPIQLIVAGKPNVEDEVGVDMARQLGEHAYNRDFEGRMVYLEDYSLEIAHMLVRGADVWLNTPERGYEASGTSGMKAGSNGVLQCSVSDGWVDEIKLDKLGWCLPDINAADTIYGFLEHEIAPLFYTRNDEGVPREWCVKMRDTIKVIEDRFTTTRMLEDYKKNLYRL